MLRSRRQMVKKQNLFVPGTFLVISLLFASGCYLFRYQAVMETHLTLMEQYSTKLQYMADNGLVVSGGDWVEFEYPGERAGEFLQIVEGQFGDRASLEAFRETLTIYEEMTADPAILTGKDPPGAVGARRAALLEAIRINRKALLDEQ